MSKTKYNFDEEDKYVEFEVFGNVYQFWFPTTEDEEKTRKENKEDSDWENKEDSDWIVDLVRSPEGVEQTPFSEAYKKMNLKQLYALTKMVEIELGYGSQDNQSKAGK